MTTPGTFLLTVLMFAGSWLARRTDLLFPSIRFAGLRTNIAMAVDTAGMAWKRG
jgi:hypothetical protein